jgi:hydroxyacylglutathione hydrolase
VKFVQYYLDCLSQASYLIGDETSGLAAVADPRRDISEYLDDAEAAGLTIAYIIETHLHADFLSGHLELAEATGATVIYGEAADVQFSHRKVKDGERISLGEVELEFRATPGHTPESISVVVWERRGDTGPFGVLTGDCLFIGDVGRPDLLASRGLTAEEMARHLHASLHSQLMTLPDETRVYPAHGAGSACGKNLSTQTVSTIGEQRLTNYAVRIADIEDFVAAVTEGQPPRPEYFSHVVDMNRQPHELLHDGDAPPSLQLEEALERHRAGSVLLDVRPPETFALAHLKGSVNVGLDGRFAEYAADVIDPGVDIVLIADAARAREAKTRLARVGFDSVRGTLASHRKAFVAHPEEVGTSSRLTVTQLGDATTGVTLLDVRGAGEREAGHIEGSAHIPLVELRNRAGELDRETPVVVYCASGYRSMIAASYLRSVGFSDVSDLLGGYQAWSQDNGP